MFWGFSDTCDLYEEYTKHVNHVAKEDENEINILLFGSSDPRHIITALAKSHKYKIKLNFFVLEGCPALIARDIILLSIALESTDLITLSARTHLFMDIYGNSLLRSTSIGYIDSKANYFIKCITDSTFNEKMQPIFDFSRLKYIERDLIENVFSFWQEKNANNVNISDCWMKRLRENLKNRFDSRAGVFDWDHQMRLKDNGAQQICSQEYKHWRETGIAFTFPEYRQSHTNKTLLMKMANNQPYTYVGDMTTGPFCGFGLNSRHKNLHKSNYGTNEYRATDITECNIYQLFYEIHEQHECEMEQTVLHRLGMTKIDNGKIFDSKQIQSNPEEMKQFNLPLIPTPYVRVTFLPINDAQHLADGNKFPKLFDIIFIGRNYFPILKEQFRQIFKPRALVLFETAQLSVQRKPEIQAFIMKIRSMAKLMNLKSISNFNINEPLSIAKFLNEND